MSETLQVKPEKEVTIDAQAERQEHLRAHTETSPDLDLNKHQEQLDNARERAGQLANDDNPIEKLRRQETAATSQPGYINHELMAINLRSGLQRIRRQLPAPQRALSRWIHQPVIRSTSEVAAKTVSRPSGLLGGGLVALLGTSGYLYLAKHIGFQYNYAVFLVLFAGGFVVGLGLELLVYLATSSRKRNNI